MMHMDYKRDDEVGFVLLGPTVEDVKQEGIIDLKRCLTGDEEYLAYVRDSILMQAEAWNGFRFDYEESVVHGFYEGHIWIRAKMIGPGPNAGEVLGEIGEDLQRLAREFEKIEDADVSDYIE